MTSGRSVEVCVEELVRVCAPMLEDRK